MATIDGAKSLGLQCEIGSIEKGKRADIILVDLMKPDIVPCHYPVSSIVYSAGGADVDTVIIDGQLVMENRVIKTVDEGALMGKMQMAADSLLERSGLGSLRDRKWPRTAL